MTPALPLDPALADLLVQARAERAAAVAARTIAEVRAEDNSRLADSLWLDWLNVALAALPDVLHRYAGLQRPPGWTRWIAAHDLVVCVPGFHPVRCQYWRDIVAPNWIRRNWDHVPGHAWRVDDVPVEPPSCCYAPTVSQALLLAQKEPTL